MGKAPSPRKTKGYRLSSSVPGILDGGGIFKFLKYVKFFNRNIKHQTNKNIKSAASIGLIRGSDAFRLRFGVSIII
jgi:hypothetical protein